MKHSVARIAQQSRRVAAKGWRGRTLARPPLSVLSIRPRGSEIERNGSDSWQCNCSFKVASLLPTFISTVYLSTYPPSPPVGFSFRSWAKIDPSERERERRKRKSLHSRRDKSLMKVNSIKLHVPFLTYIYIYIPRFDLWKSLEIETTVCAYFRG